MKHVNEVNATQSHCFGKSDSRTHLDQTNKKVDPSPDDVIRDDMTELF